MVDAMEDREIINITDSIVKDKYGNPVYPGDLVILPERYTGLKRHIYIGEESYFDGEDIADYDNGTCYKIGCLTPEEEDERMEFVCKFKRSVYARRKEDDINEAFKEGCIGIRGKYKGYVYYHLGNYNCMDDCITGKKKPCTVYLKVLASPPRVKITKDTPKFISQLLSGDRDTPISLNMQKIYSYFFRNGTPHDVLHSYEERPVRCIRCPYPIEFIICDSSKPLRIIKLLKENGFTVHNKEITIHNGASIARSNPKYSSEICDVLSSVRWELPEKKKQGVVSLDSKSSTWLDNLNLNNLNNLKWKG